MLFNTICLRLFFASTPKTTSKSSFFSIFFENVDFEKILTKHWLCAQKSRFGLQKNKENQQKNEAKTRSRKTSKKNLPKIDFGLHFGSPNPPKTARKATWNGGKTKPVSRRYGNRQQIVGRRRESEVLDCLAGQGYD